MGLPARAREDFIHPAIHYLEVSGQGICASVYHQFTLGDFQIA